MAYDNIIGRPDLAGSMLPEQVIKEIIQEAPKHSTLLTRCKNIRMTSKKAKQPVLNTLPEAYWVDGDSGLKQTTKSQWQDVYITAEELAVIVPIPDALISDADIPLWDEIKPLLAEAIGLKVDKAGLFGIDKPTSWPDAIVPSCVTAGNVLSRTAAKDLGVTVAEMGSKLARQGFAANGFAARPGLQWELVGLRNAQGDPIYTSLPNSPEQGLYGKPLMEVDNGAWDLDNDYDLLMADWSKFVIGIRQDITFDLFKEGVISDDTGKVILNLMQQDTKALRVVFRVGFQTCVPATRVGTGIKFPAGVIKPIDETGNSILSYSVGTTAGVIDATNHTVAVTLPAGTSLTDVVSTFELSRDATAKIGNTKQVSGKTKNTWVSGTPQTYAVTSETGVTQNWSVTLTVSA